MTVPAMQPSEPEIPDVSAETAIQEILFTEGIPGFSSHRNFLLEPVGGALFWLRSAVPGGPAFLVVEPSAFLPDYRIEPEEWMLASLGVSTTDDLVVLAVVTLPGEASDPPTMNLQGPILINPERHLGRQVILPDSALGTRTPIPLSQ